MELQVDKPSSKVTVDTPAIPTNSNHVGKPVDFIILDHLVLEEDKVQSNIKPSEEDPESRAEEEESYVDAMFT